MKEIMLFLLCVSLILVIPGVIAFSPDNNQCDKNLGIEEPMRGPFFGEVDSWNGNYYMILKCPKLKGSCTPGQITCDEFITRTDTGACEYTCSTAGKYVASKRCPTAWCNANRCA